jgi:predicted transposase YdaD
MLLPKPLEREFWEEFKAFEQEITMTYVTTGERIGYERGEQNLVLKQLKKRFGEISENIQQAITELSIDQLESLGEALLDFTAVDDLINWLQQNQER